MTLIDDEVESKPPVPFDTVYIDGDEVIYQAGFASQKTNYRVYILDNLEEGDHIAQFKYKKDAVAYCDEYCDGVHDPKTDCGSGVLIPFIEVQSPGIARWNAKAYIKSIMDNTGAKSALLYFTASDNFRIKRATIQPYKGNRSESSKPYHFKTIKQYLQEFYCWSETPGLEADDCLGIKGFDSWVRGYNGIIATNDKDLNMVPGWRYIPGKKRIVKIGPVQANNFFFVQMLTGDSTDNIPGLFKLSSGKAKATKAIKDWVIEGANTYERWCRVWYVYYYHTDLTEDEVDSAVWEIGDLLWMKRTEQTNLRGFIELQKGAYA